MCRDAIVLCSQVGQPWASGSTGIDTQPERAEYGSVTAKQRVEPGATGSYGATHCTRNTDGTSPAISQLVTVLITPWSNVSISLIWLVARSMGIWPRCLLIGQNGQSVHDLNCCISVCEISNLRLLSVWLLFADVTPGYYVDAVACFTRSVDKVSKMHF